MRRSLFAIRLLLGCLAFGLTARAEEPVSGSPPALPDPESHFRELCSRAQAAAEVGKFDQSRGLLLQAWALQPTPEVALALGRAEFELKRYRDAAQHLDFAIQELDATKHERGLELAKRALAEARTQVAVLHVATNRNEAEIRVDGTFVGRAPLRSPLYLDPGAHDISARTSDGAITRPVALEAGQESSLSLPIVTQVTHAEPSPWATNAPRASDSPRSRPATTVAEPQPRGLTPVIVGGAVFLAGLTTGIVFRLDSDSQFGNADAFRARLARQGCQGALSAEADCAALESAAQNGDRSRNWSTAGFIVAAGALLGTGAYWYWPRSNGKDTATTASRVRLGGAILPHASGVTISGDY